MADDDLHNLMSARAALEKKRLGLAQTIASQDAPDAAIKAIIEVQQAMEVVDIAIEELELDEELDELDEEEEEEADDDEEEEK